MSAVVEQRRAVPRLVAIYARSAVLEEDNSSEARIHQCMEYCQQAFGAVATIFRDDGASGLTLDRQGLQSLIRAVETGKINVVVVWNVDRLSRRPADRALLLDKLHRYGAELHSLQVGGRVTSWMPQSVLWNGRDSLQG
jgi:site-specific DNA recombinase